MPVFVMEAIVMDTLVASKLVSVGSKPTLEISSKVDLGLSSLGPSLVLVAALYARMV